MAFAVALLKTVHSTIKLPIHFKNVCGEKKTLLLCDSATQKTVRSKTIESEKIVEIFYKSLPNI